MREMGNLNAHPLKAAKKSKNFVGQCERVVNGKGEGYLGVGWKNDDKMLDEDNSDGMIRCSQDNKKRKR